MYNVAVSTEKKFRAKGFPCEINSFTEPSDKIYTCNLLA